MNVALYGIDPLESHIHRIRDVTLLEYLSDYQSGGWRPCHGRACSSCADREISVASSPIRPASITPIGRPSAFQCSGTFTAGCPDTLSTAVNGVNWFGRSKFWAGSTSSNQPTGRGGRATVGVRIAS